jgi:predicted ATP-grasp superfamily ATP-dependent carboligase
MTDLTEEKKEKEKKPVFVETDPQDAFPDDTIAAVRKEVRNLAKDLTVDWDSAIQVLNKAFENLQVPVPTANLKNRWEQYRNLIKDTVIALKDARGFGASWSIL